MTSDSTDPKPTQISPVQLIIGIGIIIAIILISNTGDSTSNNEPPTFPPPTEQTSSEEVQETEMVQETEEVQDMGFVVAEPRQHTMTYGNAMGDPSAPVVIIEYSDFQCSHCRSFFLETEQKLEEKYIATGKVRFVYRSFGDVFGPDSALAAQAAYCAGDQEMFWDMHDVIFYTQIPYTFENLSYMADKLGLDSSAFDQCLESEKYLERIMEDLEDAKDSGVSGTPSFVINGELAIIGNVPFSDFENFIDNLLD